MTELVVADLGGTHARFALAEIGDGRVTRLGDPVTLRTADHASLQTAWEEFARRVGNPLPPAAAIAIAGRVGGEVLRLTNNPWLIRPARIKETLGASRHVLINDFGAVGHAVAQLSSQHFEHVCGPDKPLPAHGVTSIVGPGTGLGIGQLLLTPQGYHVIETEGGHVDFAPLDPLDDRILTLLRGRYRRVSVERIVSGAGLFDIYGALAMIEGHHTDYCDERALWTAALDGSDSIAAAALDRFCLSLGSVAGDTALMHGASAVVIAGGLGLRLAWHLPQSGFGERFIAKGRFERQMSEVPVKLITHPQPGLFGAAAAFAARFGN